MVDGKTLVKKDGKSELPFGCEYSIYMKNIENRKVSVEVTIDGKDILNGRSIILRPNEDMKLERFVEDMNEGRKLRFIKKTKEIEDFRGNKPEDGLVVIKYTYERECTDPYGIGILGGPLRMRNMYNDLSCDHAVYAATNSINANSTLDASYSVKAQACASANAAPISTEKGITVEGSKSKQTFQRGHIGDLEYTSHVETIELFGYASEEGIAPAKQTVFVVEKYCPSCGTRYEYNDHTEYCVKDGTFLKETVNGTDIKQCTA